MKAIAQAAGSSQQTVYTHVHAQQTLLDTVAGRATAEVADGPRVGRRLEDAPADGSAGPAEGSIAAGYLSGVRQVYLGEEDPAGGDAVADVPPLGASTLMRSPWARIRSGSGSCRLRWCRTETGR